MQVGFRFERLGDHIENDPARGADARRRPVARTDPAAAAGGAQAARRRGRGRAGRRARPRPSPGSCSCSPSSPSAIWPRPTGRWRASGRTRRRRRGARPAARGPPARGPLRPGSRWTSWRAARPRNVEARPAGAADPHPAVPLPPRPRHEPDGWMLRGLKQGPVVRVLGPYVVSGGWWNRAGPPRVPLRRDPERASCSGSTTTAPAAAGSCRAGSNERPWTRLADVRPLWCKSNFSFLEGASHPEELVEACAALGLEAMALTDRDGVYGVVEAHVKARELGVRLIVGAEVTLDDGSTLVLLAAGPRGLRQLCRLITVGRRRSPKGESRVGWREVCEHADGRDRAVGRRAQPARRRGRPVLRGPRAARGLRRPALRPGRAPPPRRGAAAGGPPAPARRALRHPRGRRRRRCSTTSRRGASCRTC